MRRRRVLRDDEIAREKTPLFRASLIG